MKQPNTRARKIDDSIWTLPDVARDYISKRYHNLAAHSFQIEVIHNLRGHTFPILSNNPKQNYYVVICSIIPKAKLNAISFRVYYMLWIDPTDGRIIIVAKGQLFPLLQRLSQKQATSILQAMMASSNRHKSIPWTNRDGLGHNRR